MNFNAINYPEIEKNDISIIYIIKLVDSHGYIKDENANMITITESNTKALQYKSDLSKDKIQFEISETSDSIKYVQVISRIVQGSIIEYVAYQAVDTKGNEIKDPDPLPVKDNDKKKDGNDDSKAGLYVIIGVSTFLFVVVIVLVIVIVMYNSKNKDLLSQVNKISFVQSGATGKDDANLLLDNQNELD